MTTHGGVIALREPPLTDRSLTSPLRPVPQAGDVLVSKQSARADVFTIGGVAGADVKRVRRHQKAIDRVLELARELRVDGWFTCNHTHYARVANFRQRIRPGRAIETLHLDGWIERESRNGGQMLRRGDLVPHFTVKTLHGDAFSYATIWQRRNLVLIALPVTDSESARSYVSELAARGAEFSAGEADCVITQDRIQEVPSPAVLVADRWGEVVCIAAKTDVSDLPQVEDVLEWLRYVQTRCPECEGESK